MTEQERPPEGARHTTKTQLALGLGRVMKGGVR